MQLTQENLRQIEQYLYTRTVRDSQFPTVQRLKGSELVPILQDGENKNIWLNDLIANLPSDFYNISDRTNKEYCTVHQAVFDIPVNNRKLGLTVTFKDNFGNWHIYQFTGQSVNQWDSKVLWKNIIHSAIENLVYHPDEEDITFITNKGVKELKFKDRLPGEDDFVTTGTIILRRNITGSEECFIDDDDHLINALTQEMISTPNIIYVVQYDFDLEGKTVVIPDNCVLWFQGGTINNGTLVLKETAIIGAYEFSEMGNCKISGTFNTGQVMTFLNKEYKKKEGDYLQTTKPLSIEFDNNYVNAERQELRWWNGEEWIYLLDITDYSQLMAIINELIEKHNKEMSECYQYFENRCKSIEGDITNINNTLSELDSSITNIQEEIKNLKQTIENIDSSISSLIEDYLSQYNFGVSSIEVNGNTYTPDESGKVTLPDYPSSNNADHASSADTAGIADKVKNKLIFKGAVNAEYDGSTQVEVTIPEGGNNNPSDGGTADKVAHKLKFTGASNAEYDGSSDVTVNIPEVDMEEIKKLVTNETVIQYITNYMNKKTDYFKTNLVNFVDKYIIKDNIGIYDTSNRVYFNCINLPNIEKIEDNVDQYLAYDKDGEVINLYDVGYTRSSDDEIGIVYSKNKGDIDNMTLQSFKSLSNTSDKGKLKQLIYKTGQIDKDNNEISVEAIDPYNCNIIEDGELRYFKTYIYNSSKDIFYLSYECGNFEIKRIYNQLITPNAVAFVTFNINNDIPSIKRTFTLSEPKLIGEYIHVDVNLSNCYFIDKSIAKMKYCYPTSINNALKLCLSVNSIANAAGETIPKILNTSVFKSNVYFNTDNIELIKNTNTTATIKIKTVKDTENCRIYGPIAITVAYSSNNDDTDFILYDDKMYVSINDSYNIRLLKASDLTITGNNFSA